jgi:hypothetical protein
MRKLLLASVAVIGLAGVADAQVAVPSPNRTGETQNEVMINPNTRTQIRAYVMRERRAAARLPQNYVVSMGSTVPADVELYSFGTDMSDVGQYRYFMHENKTVLVDPASRRIVTILE